MVVTRLNRAALSVQWSPCGTKFAIGELPGMQTTTEQMQFCGRGLPAMLLAALPCQRLAFCWIKSSASQVQPSSQLASIHELRALLGLH